MLNENTLLDSNYGTTGSVADGCRIIHLPT